MGKETYIGLTANQFKTRFRNHTVSLRNENKRNEKTSKKTSKHTWSLKDTKTEFAVTWKMVARARPNSNLTKRCNLYITEKSSLHM